MSDGELRQLFRKHLAGFDFLPVETGSTSSGVPDLNYCRGGIEGWCEMKSTNYWRAQIRPMQIGWIERRIAHGGRVFVAVRRGRDELWFFHGSAIRQLLVDRLSTVPCLGYWSGGPANWDWVFIGATLLHYKHVPQPKRGRGRPPKNGLQPGLTD